MFSPTWSKGERIYVIILWAVIVISLAVLSVMGVMLYSSLQAGGASTSGP